MPGFTTKNGVDYNTIWYGVILPVTESYNEDPTEIQALLAETITEEYILLHHLGGGEYLPMAEFENPDQVSIEKGRLLPKPLFYGLGKGYTWQYLVRATDADIMESEKQLQYRDREFMRKQMFAPLFVEPAGDATHFGMWDGTFKSEEGLTTPPPYGVLTFTAAHTHYVGTGSPIESGVMLEDLVSAKKHIREHGHFGSLTCFMSEKNMNQIELLALPIYDNTRHAGSINVTGGTNKRMVENPLSNEVFAAGVRGSLMGITLVESAFVPDDTFLVIETGGARKGMFLQQIDNPIAQGLIQFPGDSEYPIKNSRQYRWHKPGVRIRSFAVAYQLGAAAGAYSAPAPYSTLTF